MIMSRLFFYLHVLFVMLGLPAETFANQKFGGVLLSPNGEARGVFTLTPAPGGLLVTANLKNMPEGQHAFHLHANPSCEDSFNAAGGHYNPKGEPHGFFSGKAFHLGDMPNIHVGKSGQLKIENFIHGLILSSNMPRPGTLIIHAGGDDYISQPSGAAGARIACGVVE